MADRIGFTQVVKRAVNGWGWKLSIALSSIVMTMAVGWIAFAGDVMMKDEYEQLQTPFLKQLDRNTDAITEMSKGIAEMVGIQRELLRRQSDREKDYRAEQRAIRDRIDRIFEAVAPK